MAQTALFALYESANLRYSHVHNDDIENKI